MFHAISEVAGWQVWFALTSQYPAGTVVVVVVVVVEVKIVVEVDVSVMVVVVNVTVVLVVVVVQQIAEQFLAGAFAGNIP